MIKKIVCAALMLSILAMSSMGAFAAVTSSTQYAEEGYITVTTEVSDVATGDTVTYLAYKGGTPADDNIAFIDQKTLAAADINEGVYTFTYTTAVADIGATVKQGGLKADGSAITLASGTIPEVPVVGCVIKVNGADAVTYETLPSGDYMEVPFTGVPASVMVGAVEVDGWYATAGGFAIPTTLWTVDGIDLTVTTATAATTVTLDGVKGYADSKAAVVTVAGDADKYGVIFTDDVNYENVVEINGENIDAAGKAAKFVALGKGSDGKFMITVSGEFEVGSKFYAKAFADALTSGEYVEVTVK